MSGSVLRRELVFTSKLSDALKPAHDGIDDIDRMRTDFSEATGLSYARCYASLRLATVIVFKLNNPVLRSHDS